MAVSLGNIFAYTLILGAAFKLRQQPSIHKRLIMIGMVTLLSAPFGRLLDLPYQLPHVIGPGIVVVSMASFEFATMRRLHAVTLCLGPAVLLWELLPNLYMNSPWWLAFARWLTIVAV